MHWTQRKKPKLLPISGFWKKKKRCSKKYHFWPKQQQILIVFFLLQEPYFVKSWVFFALCSVHQNTSFELSQTVFWTIFQIFHHMVIWRDQKVTRHRKRSKKIPQKNSNRGAKRNKKMGGWSHVITFGVFPFKSRTL